MLFEKICQFDCLSVRVDSNTGKKYCNSSSNTLRIAILFQASIAKLLQYYSFAILHCSLPPSQFVIFATIYNFSTFWVDYILFDSDLYQKLGTRTQLQNSSPDSKSG